MGYTTEFNGSITVTPPLNEHEVSFLKAFNTTRRMNRTNGPLFVEGTGPYGQGHDPDVLDHNSPHPDQPGLWCQWEVTDDGTEIQWDGGEKFYYAPEWMEYLVKKLLSAEAKDYVAAHRSEDARLAHFTCDHNFHGVIEAQGEDEDDRWVIEVVTV